MLKYFLFIVSFLFIIGCKKERAKPQYQAVNVPIKAPPTASKALKNVIQQFEDSLLHAMQTEGFPGAAFAVVENGEIVHSKGYGIRQAGCPEQVDSATVFRIASLSKGFPSVLTGMLIQDSLLNWDDQISQYVPNLILSRTSARDSLSIRHLLSHTTGLPRHTFSNLLNMGVPYPDILKKLKEVRIAHPPGTWYNYQNVAYSLIGDVIGKVVGKSYAELLAERIFLPLGMHQASTGFYALQASENVAAPHLYDGKKYFAAKSSNNFYSVLPAAGVNASIQDMAQWISLMLGHHPDLLDSLTLQEIEREQIAVSPRENVMRAWRPLETSGYGLGWRTATKNHTRFVFHGGFVNGYRAEIILLPDQDIGMVLLTNSNNQFVGHSLPYFLNLVQGEIVR
ncbi:MAG: hypothetical protein DHS20C18_34140 [Saprospiraceae bacterium]|nr:MAG: hypothetical protein DHS20C18_34140 [Saprospiraceae bacterium]